MWKQVEQGFCCRLVICHPFCQPKISKALSLFLNNTITTVIFTLNEAIWPDLLVAISDFIGEISYQN